MRRKNAELEAVRREMKQTQADRDVPLKEQVCLHQVCQTKSTLVELQKQIADLTIENTRLKVCAESPSADRDSVRVELHDALKQKLPAAESSGGTDCETPGAGETQC